jgi:hypothetical protein
MPRPEHELKERLRQANLPFREAADKLKTPYGTLAGWLNGFAPLPEDARKQLLQMAEDAQTEKMNIDESVDR